MSTDSIAGLKEFHESYFGHNCTIQERKADVLKTDIRGGSHCLRELRRWWHGLFLVSYSDERTKLYYTSSEAIRLDRARQFRYFKGRIHPLSKFRNFWDCLMLTLFILNTFMVHHNFSVIHGKVSRYFYYIGPIIELFIIADLIVNIKTGYIDNEARRVIIEKYEGVMHYCSSKIFLHVASAIPIQWILILRHGAQVDCGLCKTNYFIFTLRSLAVFGLFRIYECSSYWTRERSSFIVTSAYRFVRVFVLGLLTLLYVQEMADKSMLMVMINNGVILSDSYTGQLLYGSFVLPRFTTCHTLFLISILRAIKSAIQITFSATDYHIDRVVTIISYVIVSFFYLWSVSEVYAFVTGIQVCENNIHKFKTDARSMVRCRQLPDKLSKKIHKYYEFKNAHMKVIEQRNIFFMTMPQTLKRESFLSTHWRYMKRIPYFSEWPPEVIEEIVMMLKKEIYLNNDMVAEPWVPSEGLTIVAVGELAVYGGEEERGHLIDGDFFGELSLVTDKELRTSSVFAITACVVLLLDKIPFRIFMRNYPELFLELNQKLKNKFDKNTELKLTSKMTI